MDAGVEKMSDGHDESEQAHAEPPVDPQRVNRRSALKKAAAASAAAGAVWAAPRIEGMAVVPDYASAGTTTFGPLNFIWDSDGPGLAAGSNDFVAQGRPGYNVVTDGRPPGGVMVYSAPMGVAGNATLTLPAAVTADGNAFTGTVAFAIDPPFNKCAVTGGNFGPVTPAFFGNLPGGSFTIGANTVPNTSANFSVPFTMPGRPGNAVRVNDCTITIQCT